MKFAAIFLLAVPFLRAQTAPPACSAATLTGTRTLTMTGRTSALSQIFLAAGTATFDGVSAVTFNLAVDTGQSVSATQKWSGTYTIGSNCIGTITTSIGDTASFTLIPYSSGNSFSITGQDTTFTYTGTGTSQPVDGCLTSSYTGAYAFSGNGYALSAGLVSQKISSGVAQGVNTVAGLLEFDGNGNITGSWSVATNGSATSATLTGKYTVATPGCTAAAIVTDQNNVAYELNFVVSSTNSANFTMIGATAPVGSGTLELAFTGSGHSTFTYPGLAVENAAGISGGTPPGSLFSIYGYGLSNGKAQTETTTWPTKLASAQVTVNGETAPLYYADDAALGSEGLINAQMPLDIPPGLATVVVTNGTSVSNAVAITVPSTANPGVFIYGTNHAAAQNFPSYATNSASAPAKPGSVVIVYFTGGGEVQGAGSINTGKPTPGSTFPLVTTKVQVTIGGVSAALDYIGLTPTLIGVYQADIVVPTLSAGDHNLILTIDGVASNTTVISTN